MQTFLNKDFLLRSELARKLYHDEAENLPIVDYHTHIPVRDIVEDRKYRSITDVLIDTTVAQRLMRAAGLPESRVSGHENSAEARFHAYAEILPEAAGSLAHTWAHRVLRRCFDCDLVISKETADEIWRHCNGRLAQPTYTTKQILSRGGVETVVTSDDAADDLKWQKRLHEEGAPFDVRPAMHFGRTLDVMGPDWGNYIRYTLGQAADVEIDTMADVRTAVTKQMDAFAALGCTTVDMPLPTIVYRQAEEYELDDILGRLINGCGEVTREDAEMFQTAMLHFVGQECVKRDWVMQLHYGILRGRNRKMVERMGADAAFDCISAASDSTGLATLLNDFVYEDAMPRLLVTSMNPADQAIIGSVIGAFQGQGRVPIQQGFSWVGSHSRRGIELQLTAFSSFTILGRILAPASEAHTAVSWPRHAFYRRILCDYLAGLVEEGLYPDDEAALRQIVRQICYENVRDFFRLTERAVKKD